MPEAHFRDDLVPARLLRRSLGKQPAVFPNSANPTMDEPDLRAIQSGGLQLELSRFPEVVGIEEGDKIRGAVSQSDVSGGGGAARADAVGRQDFDPAIRRSEADRNLLAAIRAAIVDHEDGPGPMRLAQGGVDGPRHKRRLVVEWNDNVDAALFGNRLRRRLPLGGQASLKRGRHYAVPRVSASRRLMRLRGRSTLPRGASN
jgi:hypothetical protein